MADFRWKPIETIREGEYVIGFERPSLNKHLKMKPAKVVQTICRPRSQTVRVATDKGSVVCTPDHRFYHCTPGIQYTWKRAMSLRPGNRIRFVADPFGHEETIDFQRGWLAGVAAGDGCFWNCRKDGRQYRRFRLAVKDIDLIEAFIQRAHRLGYELHKAPHTHTGFNGIHREQMPAAWLTTDKICQEFEAAINQPGDHEYSRGWLSGFFDAEGTFSGYVHFAQSEHSRHLETLSRHLDALNFRRVKTPKGMRLGASVQEGIRFFNECPPILKRKLKAIYGVSSRTWAEVQAVLPEGEAETYNLTTETHNYVADGFLVKNCDSEFTFTGGTRMTVDEIIAEVEKLDCHLVELTGGEPLLQADINELAVRLLDAGHTVLIETGGHRDIAKLDERVIRIMDLKCPASGECDKNLWSNLEHLRPQDEVKFVIADRADYEWTLRTIHEHRLEDRVKILISTVFESLSPRSVVEWMLEDRLRARFQLQLHKYIWPMDARRV